MQDEASNVDKSITDRVSLTEADIKNNSQTSTHISNDKRMRYLGIKYDSQYQVSLADTDIKINLQNSTSAKIMNPTYDELDTDRDMTDEVSVGESITDILNLQTTTTNIMNPMRNELDADCVMKDELSVIDESITDISNLQTAATAKILDPMCNVLDADCGLKDEVPVVDESITDISNLQTVTSAKIMNPTRNRLDADCVMKDKVSVIEESITGISNLQTTITAKMNPTRNGLDTNCDMNDEVSIVDESIIDNVSLRSSIKCNLRNSASVKIMNLIHNDNANKLDTDYNIQDKASIVDKSITNAVCSNDTVIKSNSQRSATADVMDTIHNGKNTDECDADYDMKVEMSIVDEAINDSVSCTDTRMKDNLKPNDSDNLKPNDSNNLDKILVNDFCAKPFKVVISTDSNLQKLNDKIIEGTRKNNKLPFQGGYVSDETSSITNAQTSDDINKAKTSNSESPNERRHEKDEDNNRGFSNYDKHVSGSAERQNKLHSDTSGRKDDKTRKKLNTAVKRPTLSSYKSFRRKYDSDSSDDQCFDKTVFDKPSTSKRSKRANSSDSDDNPPNRYKRRFKSINNKFETKNTESKSTEEGLNSNCKINKKKTEYFKIKKRKEKCVDKERSISKSSSSTEHFSAYESKFTTQFADIFKEKSLENLTLTLKSIIVQKMCEALDSRSTIGVLQDEVERLQQNDIQYKEKLQNAEKQMCNLKATIDKYMKTVGKTMLNQPQIYLPYKVTRTVGLQVQSSSNCFNDNVRRSLYQRSIVIDLSPPSSPYPRMESFNKSVHMDVATETTPNLESDDSSQEFMENDSEILEMSSAVDISSPDNGSCIPDCGIAEAVSQPENSISKPSTCSSVCNTCSGSGVVDFTEIKDTRRSTSANKIATPIVSSSNKVNSKTVSSSMCDVTQSRTSNSTHAVVSNSSVSSTSVTRASPASRNSTSSTSTDVVSAADSSMKQPNHLQNPSFRNSMQNTDTEKTALVVSKAPSGENTSYGVMEVPTPIIATHPAPLPDTVSLDAPPFNKLIPPQPLLRIAKGENGIVLSWNMTLNPDHASIASYQLYSYQEVSNVPPDADSWKIIGEVQALPLPMACTLTQFMEGHRYHFAIRAVDIYSRIGLFSTPGSILLFSSAKA